jgi:predicted AAA+ superfamily ATPase
MFRRKIYDKLLEWKATSNGKTALLIEGARRVGKTTIVEEFAKNEYQSHILIDFAFATTGVKELFHDISDLDYLFLQLQLQFKADLHERRSLIIFDEVQFCPQARQAIKNLVQDGRYDYIETGSLISIKKNVQNILIPSEERKIEMFPMDFEEFLWATGDHTTNELLRKIFSEKISLGQRQNRELMRKFRLYMLVGGMPQAVNAYLETNNFKYVDEVVRTNSRLFL